MQIKFGARTLYRFPDADSPRKFVESMTTRLSGSHPNGPVSSALRDHFADSSRKNFTPFSYYVSDNKQDVAILTGTDRLDYEGGSLAVMEAYSNADVNTYEAATLAFHQDFMSTATIINLPKI